LFKDRIPEKSLTSRTAREQKKIVALASVSKIAGLELIYGFVAL